MTHQRFLEVRHTQESFTAQPLVARTLGWGKVRCTCISNGKLSCCNTEMPSSVGHCHFTGHCSHLFGKRTWNVLGVPDWKWHTSFLPTFQNLAMCKGVWEVSSSHVTSYLPIAAAPVSPLLTGFQPLIYPQSIKDPSSSTSGLCKCCALCPKGFASSWHGSFFSVTLTDQPMSSTCFPCYSVLATCLFPSLSLSLSLYL